MVEVFEVGAAQVRGWCGWLGCKCDGQLVAGVHCDSLAKGKYIVVGCWSEFGCAHMTSPWILKSGGLRECMAFCDDYLGGRAGHFVSVTDSAWEYEIWHVVDTPDWVIEPDPELFVDDDGKYVTFSTMDDVEGYVHTALGDWSSDFDVTAIARDIVVFIGGSFFLLDVDFWDICAVNEFSVL